MLLTGIADSRLIKVVHFEHPHDSCTADIRVCIPQALLDWRHLRATSG